MVDNLLGVEYVLTKFGEALDSEDRRNCLNFYWCKTHEYGEASSHFHCL